MNLFLNYLVLIIAVGLAGLYFYNMLINIIRTNQVKKELIDNCAALEGTVSKLITKKKKTYVKVRFTSPTSGMLFELFFEYFTDDWKDRAKVGDNITIIYPEVSKVKKITAFPTFLEGDKIKMPIGAFVTDLMLLLFSAYVVYSIVYNMIQKNAFVTNVPVTEVTSGVMLVLYFVMHFLLITYVIDRLNNAPTQENQNYLQIYGVHTNAEVTTFKFAGSKNARGYKEAQMEIEYFNGVGEKIKAKCASYYYSETQEQFISILYDPKNYKNVVYIKHPEKAKKNKK